MPSLSSQHIAILQKLLENGFEIVSFPLYPNSVGVRKGNCAALLSPQEGGGMRVFGAPSFLVDGELSVRVTRNGQEFYVWKKQELPATPERMAEVEEFRNELLSLLGPG